MKEVKQKTVYVYVESIESKGFQFVPFPNEMLANRFILGLSKRSKTLSSRIWHFNR